MPTSWKDKEPQGSLSHDMAVVRKNIIESVKYVSMFILFASSLAYLTKFL